MFYLLIVLLLCIFKALPMVTVIVGRKNDDCSDAQILTCCEGADDPAFVKFSTKNLVPGEPK